MLAQPISGHRLYDLWAGGEPCFLGSGVCWGGGVGCCCRWVGGCSRGLRGSVARYVRFPLVNHGFGTVPPGPVNGRAPYLPSRD